VSVVVGGGTQPATRDVVAQRLHAAKIFLVARSAAVLKMLTLLLMLVNAAVWMQTMRPGRLELLVLHLASHTIHVRTVVEDQLKK
jgi:hypothetical protein